jgi:predicted MFS family arabinose efflux permease
VGLIVAGVAAAVLLVPIERRAVTPIFPLRVLATPESRWLNLAGLLSGAVMFILIFYIPLLLQDVFGYSPSHAGLLMTPLVAGTSVGSIVNGRLFPKQSEPSRLMIFGSGVLALGCLLTLTFTAESPGWWVFLSMSLCGIGLGFMLPNFTLFMQMLAEQRDVGVALALVQTTRALGSAFGTALVGIVVARISIVMGIKMGLVLCVVMSITIAWVCSRIKMRNFSK